MNRIFIVAVALLGIAACATSGPESPVTGLEAETSATTDNPTAAVAEGVTEQVGDPDATTMAAVADGDEMVCTRERLTGTRIKKKICMTRAERDRIREVNQANWDAERRTPEPKGE